MFVDGYWDLPLANRGLLFAPVYYASPVYLQPAYVFTPSITIASSGLMASLFIQPSYYHYCFGDYYDRSFLSVGIFPWFSFTYSSSPGRPVLYDPLFSFYAATYVRSDPGWAVRVREEYIVRRDNVAMRPPRTYIEQSRIIERNPAARETLMARPLHQLAARPESAGGMRLERVGAEARSQWQRRGAQLAEFRQERSRQERQPSSWRPGGGTRIASAAGGQGHARPLSLPASPVSAPIHHHEGAGAPVGPQLHRDHPAGSSGSAWPPGFRHAESAAPATSDPGAVHPMVRHQGDLSAPVSNHHSSIAAAAPHDVAVAGGRSQSPVPRHEASSRPAAPPHLHEPPQYTHRQPPPPPRPVHHGAHQPGPQRQ
jgi:hypothetical protein